MHAEVRVVAGGGLQEEVRESTGKDVGKLVLWSDAPRWELSTAPLAYADGIPVPLPTAGAGGHAILLNDQQVPPPDLQNPEPQALVLQCQVPAPEAFCYHSMTHHRYWG